MSKIAIIKDDNGYFKKYTNGNKYVTTTLYNENMEFIGNLGRHPNDLFSMDFQVLMDIELFGGKLVYLK